MVSLILLAAASATLAPVRTDSAERQIRQTVYGFYQAFNAHDFSRAELLTTPGWNHINPLGGRTQGRGAVLKELRQVHATFLKHTTDTPESFDVEIIAPTVALATVQSRVSGYTAPDGVRHVNEPQIRTFVVVKTKAGWRITRDHNTIVAMPKR